MHRRLAMNSVLNDTIKKGVSYLTETNFLQLEEQKLKVNKWENYIIFQ
jgi:hypothetical protein